MKVICINDGWRPSDEEIGKPNPYFGEKCEVTNSKMWQGALYYQLGGRFDKGSGFRADHFAPTSNINEATFERTYKKELV